MKNLLRKFIVFSIVAVMFILPASSALASSVPTLIYNRNGDKIYEYQSAFELAPGESALLYDFKGNHYGAWYVPAGETFDFLCYFEEGVTTLRFSECRVLTGETTDVDLDLTWPVFRQTISPKSEDDSYYMTVTNTGTKTVKIYNYQGCFLD